jgi:hypothetical protein
MKPGRIAAWAITAIAVPGLAACSGSSPGGTSPTAGSSRSDASSPAVASSSGQSRRPASRPLRVRRPAA